jgi:hypothetical protein
MYTQYMQVSPVVDFSKPIVLSATSSIPATTYSARLDFTPGLEDPPGRYTWTLAGQKGVVVASADLHPPDGPRLHVADSFHLLLYHFSPGELVRLFCYDSYDPQGKLRAWQDIAVDPSGNQSVVVKTAACNFVALGPSSREVHQDREVTGTIQKICGEQTSRLGGQKRARIALIDGTTRPLRPLPGDSQEVRAYLSEGTNLTVGGLPHCIEGSLWWSVITEYGDFGWLPEAQNGVFVLEPLP